MVYGFPKASEKFQSIPNEFFFSESIFWDCMDEQIKWFLGKGSSPGLTSNTKRI